MSFVGEERWRPTPLGIFGGVLAVLVVLDVLAWLWSMTLGADIDWGFYAYFGGMALIVLWLGYLVTWVIRRRRYAWHLLVIPVIGLVAVATAVADLPHKLRWAYDEPRLTAAAEAFLADPRTDFYDVTDLRIGSQEIRAVGKADGAIAFHSPNLAFISIGHFEYRPDGSSPAFGGEIRGNRVDDHWWVVLID